VWPIPIGKLAQHLVGLIKQNNRQHSHSVADLMLKCAPHHAAL